MSMPFTAMRPHVLLPLAPTTSWSSNLFGSDFGSDPARVQGTATGQVAAPYGAWVSGVALAGTALGAYHGYKRTGSVGWSIGWALLGGLFPFITVPVALAQGFGKPEPAFRRRAT